MLATARTFYDVTADPAKLGEIVDFHWFNKFSTKNNFKMARGEIVEIGRSQPAEVDLTNQDYQQLHSGTDDPIFKALNLIGKSIFFAFLNLYLYRRKNKKKF